MDIKTPTFIDLFAGAGGFGLGFKLAGFKGLCSVEIDKWAADTIRHNDRKMKVIQDDIRKFDTKEKILNLCQEIPDIIIGGPPCQGFSVAGRADPSDPRNSLFIDFARWVKTIKPKVFVMENVKGLLGRKNASGEKVIDIITNTFRELDYKVEIWILNAAEYGVPQIRERVFIVGNNLGIERIGIPRKTHSLSNLTESQNLQSSFFQIQPDYLPAVILWDAISDLPELEAGEGEEEQKYINPAQTEYQKWARNQQEILYNHVAMKHSKRLVERFKYVEWGESSANVPEEHRARSRNGNGKISDKMYDQNNRRLNPYKPSHTIAASFYANFIHPFKNRNLTAREGARIQSFPDWYRFMGRKTVVSQKLLEREGRFEDKHLCQFSQIGNAVPPLLALKIAEHIKEVIYNDISSWV